MKTYIEFVVWIDKMGLMMEYDCESGEYLVTSYPPYLKQLERYFVEKPSRTLIASVPSRWVRWEFDKAKELVEAGLMLANM